MPNFKHDFNDGEVGPLSHWGGILGGPPAFIVPSGAQGGIKSFSGDFHATGILPNTGWGGYTNVFPDHGWRTSVDVYLDIDVHTNGKRLKFTSAVTEPDGTYGSDHFLLIGFYNDGIGPGANTKRFVASTTFPTATNDPRLAINDPQVIASETGWYTIQQDFLNNSGNLTVETSVLKDGYLIYTWIDNRTFVIGVHVGGNRYGWFNLNEFRPYFAFDNSFKVDLEPLAVKVSSTNPFTVLVNHLAADTAPGIVQDALHMLCLCWASDVSVSAGNARQIVVNQLESQPNSPLRRDLIRYAKSTPALNFDFQP